MATVVVRQWSDRVFAAYVFDGDVHGTFVGTETTRQEAHRVGLRRARERAATRGGES